MDLQTILRSIRRADIDYDLIADGDRIAVGVSGGKDSMVLLSALHMYSKFKGKNFQVVGIHIKLGFPNMDFREVVSYCEQLGIEFHIIDSKVYEILQKHPDANGNIKCSLCSKFKKATVIEAAKQFNCHKVAFGHHSDDAVETLLMNAIFGGKLAVFLPKMYMSRTDITFIRPLIYAFEEDILIAQQKNNIPYVESTCPNDGFTQRQEMKEMLHEFYKKYPMARYNFQNMLSNEEQVELWHKTTARVAKRNHDKPMQILLEEQDLQLGQRGRHFFLIYSPKQLPDLRHHKKIPHSDADRLLSKQLTLHDYMESIKAELDL
ncbi:tRNA lysidine(34) synthetase [Amedibacillus dolichus]|uniref:PP-loop family protein n=1 Tax=Amedibacillus dolichus DSM 3991 TaxID=428127 RepID=A8RBN1_9FIRM|nr:tRNA 2-thiocytidine biosynthesis TtcA family protein [Amedibacillus dolichus]EDP11217.1 PP-loop family protein [Amedibacillus dolichus DSM 3991]